MLGDGPVTVSVARLLFTGAAPAAANAVMCVVPGLRAFTFAVTAPVVELIVTESTVATSVLSEVKLISTFVIGRPYSSNACAVNGVVCPTVTLAGCGAIVTVVRWPGQFPNGVPFTRKPGE